jgi:hypothetical protein
MKGWHFLLFDFSVLFFHVFVVAERRTVTRVVIQIAQESSP